MEMQLSELSQASDNSVPLQKDWRVGHGESFKLTPNVINWFDFYYHLWRYFIAGPESESAIALVLCVPDARLKTLNALMTWGQHDEGLTGIQAHASGPQTEPERPSLSRLHHVRKRSTLSAQIK